MTPDDLQAKGAKRLDVALRLAKEAGELLVAGQKRPLTITKKGAIDLVTEMDLASESLILEGLRQAFPEDGLWGEESGKTVEGSSGFTWVVDPVDGTTNYAHGLPLYCISIGALHEGRPCVGVIHAPALNELYAVAPGQAPTLNGEPIHVSAPAELNDALLVTGFPYDVRINRTNLDHFEYFVTRARAVRRLGSAAIDLAWVASGRFDGFWEARLGPWDMAAGWALVEAAGGVVTRYDGSPFQVDGHQIVASHGGLLHNELCVGLR